MHLLTVIGCRLHGPSTIGSRANSQGRLDGYHKVKWSSHQWWTTKTACKDIKRWTTWNTDQHNYLFGQNSSQPWTECKGSFSNLDRDDFNYPSRLDQRSWSLHLHDRWETRLSMLAMQLCKPSQPRRNFSMKKTALTKLCRLYAHRWSIKKSNKTTLRI